MSSTLALDNINLYQAYGILGVEKTHFFPSRCLVLSSSLLFLQAMLRGILHRRLPLSHSFLQLCLKTEGDGRVLPIHRPSFWRIFDNDADRKWIKITNNPSYWKQTKYSISPFCRTHDDAKFKAMHFKFILVLLIFVPSPAFCWVSHAPWGNHPFLTMMICKDPKMPPPSRSNPDSQLPSLL